MPDAVRQLIKLPLPLNTNTNWDIAMAMASLSSILKQHVYNFLVEDLMDRDYLLLSNECAKNVENAFTWIKPNLSRPSLVVVSLGSN